MNIKRFYTTLILLLFANVFTAFTFLENNPDAIIGTWLTAGDDNAKIEIFKSGSKYYGKIVWMKNPLRNGEKALDVNNPDESKHNDPLLGLQIIKGFIYNAEENIWEDGKIYDPQSGKTYSCIIKKEGNKLKVRGYIGFSLLGRTEIWTKTN